MATEKPSKHIKSFWPLFGIVIFSMIIGGAIYAVAFGNMMQDDLNSLDFGSSRHVVAPKPAPVTYKK